MASVGGEDEEYESDPEQAKLSLTMRRREASDDEDDNDQEEEVEVLPPGPRTSTRGIDSSRVSDCDSDGQGAAADYDDEDSDYYEEDEEEIVEEEYYEVSGGRHADGKGMAAGMEVKNNINNNEGHVEEDAISRGDEKLGGVPTEGGGEYYNVEEDEEHFEDNASGGKVQEEKKENEPFAVPTAGAFYMHDDRLRDSAGGGGGRHGRTFGGRKLWESKDDRKWGHDKFEEMTMQERHYEEGRRASRGRNRGRGRSRGEERGFSRGSRPKPFNNSNQNNVPKAVRGRGPRRYQPTFKNNSEAPMQNRQPGKSAEKSSHASSGRAPVTQSSLESAPVPARNNVFASSLSSASPPFYPSGSSNKEINLTQKRDQAGPINRNLRPPVMRESFTMQQSNTMGGKNVTDSTVMDRLHINDSVSPFAGKPLTNMSLPISGPPFINSTQPLQSRVQGRGSTPMGQMAYQPTGPPHNQVNRVSSTQNHGYQRSPAQNRLQPSMQSSNQQLGKRPGAGSQASSPPKAALSIHSLDSAESESAVESSNSKTALVGKGKGSIQGSGRGSFPYAGAQVIGAAGNIGGGHGEQNFPFLPVMQFGGQHPGGIGVPAVGMAFPGYVAQPNGLGNSEMTWLPVLAGAAGALGATYCSPYLTVDGSYHARPAGQTSSLPTAVSKENNINKLGSELKPSQRPEPANEELGQRQNKPRRYTEMKFDQ